MKPIVKKLLMNGAALLLPASWIGSEIHYAVRIRPTDIHTVADHCRRFGEPRFVYEVARGGSNYYEFSGFPPAGPPVLAFPSSAPAYIYDSKGRFVTWCSDPGDEPNHRKTWPRVSTTSIDIQTVRQRLSK